MPHTLHPFRMTAARCPHCASRRTRRTRRAPRSPRSQVRSPRDGRGWPHRDWRTGSSAQQADCVAAARRQSRDSPPWQRSANECRGSNQCPQNAGRWRQRTTRQAGLNKLGFPPDFSRPTIRLPSSRGENPGFHPTTRSIFRLSNRWTQIFRLLPTICLSNRWEAKVQRFASALFLKESERKLG